MFAGRKSKAAHRIALSWAVAVSLVTGLMPVSSWAAEKTQDAALSDVTATEVTDDGHFSSDADQSEDDSLEILGGAPSLGDSDSQQNSDADAESSQESTDTADFAVSGKANVKEPLLASKAAAPSILRSATPTATEGAISGAPDVLQLYKASSNPKSFNLQYLPQNDWMGSYWNYSWAKCPLNITVEDVDNSGLLDVEYDTQANSGNNWQPSIQVKHKGEVGNTTLRITFTPDSSNMYASYYKKATLDLPVEILEAPNYAADVQVLKDGAAHGSFVSLYAFPSPDPNDNGRLFQQSSTFTVSFIGHNPDQSSVNGTVEAESSDESIAKVTSSEMSFTITGQSEGIATITVKATPEIPVPENPNQVIEKTIQVEVKGLIAPTPKAATAQLAWKSSEAGSKNQALITYNTPENATNEGLVAWLASKKATLESYTLWWRFISDAQSEDPEVFDIEPIASGWWASYKFTSSTAGLTYLTITDQWGQNVIIPVVITSEDDYPVPQFRQEEYSIKVGTNIADVAESWMTASVYHYDPLIKSNAAPVYVTTKDLGVDAETGEDNNVISLGGQSRNDKVETNIYNMNYHNEVLDGTTTQPQYKGINAVKVGYVTLYAYYLQPHSPYGADPVLLDLCFVNVVDEDMPISQISIYSVDTENNNAQIPVKTTMGISKMQQLKAVFLPADATEYIGWESSDESVISIDNKGAAVARNAGMATITAFAADAVGNRIEGGKSTSVDIAVNKDIRKIAISSLTQRDDVLTPLKLDFGTVQSYQLEGKVYPSDAYDSPVFAWRVEDVEGSDVCRIRQDGMLIPRNYGKARVYCMLEGTDYVDSINVEVSKITPSSAVSIDVDCPDIMVYGANDETVFTATLNPRDSTDSVVWSSSNEKVLSINPATGAAKLVADGRATVKATVVNEDGVARADVPAAEKQVTCQIPLTGIELPSEVALNKVRGVVKKYVWPDGYIDAETDIINNTIIEAVPSPESLGGIRYAWEAVGEVDSSVISGWSGSGTKLTVTSDTDKGAIAAGSATFRVTATDRYGNSFQKDVTVNVTPNVQAHLYVNGVEISEDVPLELTEDDEVHVECYIGQTRVEDRRMLVSQKSGGGISQVNYGGWGGWIRASQSNEDNRYPCIISASIYDGNGRQIGNLSPTARVIVHPRPYDQPPTAIGVSPNKVMLNINEDEYDMSYTLSWPAVKKGGTYICPKGSGYNYVTSPRVNVAWYSSDPSIAEVDAQTGHVIPLAIGTVYVYGAINYQSDDGVWSELASARSRVDVFEPDGDTPARKVNIARIPQLKVGESVRASAQVMPYPYASQKVTWTTSNDRVTSVDSSTGTIVARGEGACTVFATAEGGIRGSVLVSVSGYKEAIVGETNAGGIFSSTSASAPIDEIIQTGANIQDNATPMASTNSVKSYRNVEEATSETVDSSVQQVRNVIVVSLSILSISALIVGGIYRYRASSRRQQ